MASPSDRLPIHSDPASVRGRHRPVETVELPGEADSKDLTLTLRAQLPENVRPCPYCGHHTLYKPEGWVAGGPLMCANPLCDSNQPPD